MAQTAINGQADRPANTLLVTEAEAAKQLAISPRKLWELRNRGEIPHLRVGRAVRYDLRDLQAWIDAQKQRIAVRRGPGASIDALLPYGRAGG